MFIQTDQLLRIISVPISLLLLITQTANARPTVTAQKIVSATNSCTTEDRDAVSYTINNSAGYIDGKFAEFGKQFLQPPSNFAALSSAAADSVKPLPAVPATVIMVMIGFLCVSMVRDRKVWLAVLSGLLCAGQIGIQAVPQLALRLLHKNHTESRTEFTRLYSPEDSYRLRNDIEGTQYIGLLHHLARIPGSPMSFPHIRLSFLPRHLSFLQPRLSFLRKQESRTANYKLLTAENTPQFAIITLLSHLSPETNCLSSRVEQFICFTPAFIFSRIPRGPPILIG